MFIVGTFVLSLGFLGSGLQGLHVSICINSCLYIFVNKMRGIYIYYIIYFMFQWVIKGLGVSTRYCLFCDFMFQSKDNGGESIVW